MESRLDSVRGRVLEGLDVARRAGADGARIVFQHHEASNCDFEAGRLKTASASEALGVSIDVLVNGRTGATAGNRLDDLGRLITDAVALARAAGRRAYFTAWPAPQALASVPLHSARTAALTRDELLAPCQEFVAALRAVDTELRIDAGAGRHESEWLLATTGGVCYAKSRSGWHLGGHVQRTRGTDILSAGDGRGWGEVNAWFDIRPVIERVIEDLRHAERTVEPPMGKVLVFLPPETLQAFLWPLSLGINGRTVAKGESPLAGRLGQRVLAPCFTIIDDPHVPYGGGSEIDTDGIPTRRHVLADRGVLQRFLYDLDSAGLAKAEPTGNNGCSPYHVMVQPGQRSSRDLLRSIRDGLVVKALIGFGQSNILNGDFSANVGLGFRVRDGEVVGRVKDTMIAGNLYELLNLDDCELSSDTNFNGAIPYAVVPGVTVKSRTS